MRKNVLILALVVTIGFLSGYFSENVLNYIGSAKYRELAFMKKGSLFNYHRNPEVKRNLPSIKGAISEESAVAAAKSLPEIKKRLSDAALRRAQVSFKADQAPNRENPVWLLQLKEVNSSNVQDIMFVKVDAFSGAVLDLRKNELQVSGVNPGMPISQVFRLLGKPLKTQKLRDAETKEYNNIYFYQDAEIACDSKNAVTRVVITGASRQGPRGLKPGMKKEEVIKKLGKAEITQDTLFIYNTMDDKSIQLHIMLDTKGLVSSISTVKLSPVN